MIAPSPANVQLDRLTHLFWDLSMRLQTGILFGKNFSSFTLYSRYWKQLRSANWTRNHLGVFKNYWNTHSIPKLLNHKLSCKDQSLTYLKILHVFTFSVRHWFKVFYLLLTDLLVIRIKCELNLQSEANTEKESMISTSWWPRPTHSPPLVCGWGILLANIMEQRWKEFADVK